MHNLLLTNRQIRAESRIFVEKRSQQLRRHWQETVSIKTRLEEDGVEQDGIIADPDDEAWSIGVVVKHQEWVRKVETWISSILVLLRE